MVLPEGVPGATKAERVRNMFARIVPRYDRLNRLMTLGQDQLWRRAVARQIGGRVGWALDVGTGTGDLALALASQPGVAVVGVDFVEAMLEVASRKARVGSAGVVSFAAADALALPFADATFDWVTNGFLLRNVADLTAALAEMVRVLRPGGRLLCLEITHPPAALAPFFGLYFGRVVPLLGALIAGAPQAYQYLPASLGPLPAADRLAALLREAGLVNVSYRRLGLGTVALHVGEKPASDLKRSY